MKKSQSALLVLAASTMLSACNLAPKYDRPQAAVPVALPQGEGVYPAVATDAPDISKIGWRQVVVDESLQQVIQTGLDNNQDLRLAAANVLQARHGFSIGRVHGASHRVLQSCPSSNRTHEIVVGKPRVRVRTV